KSGEAGCGASCAAAGAGAGLPVPGPPLRRRPGGRGRSPGPPTRGDPVKDEVLRLFAERGVTVNDIAVIVHHLQNPHMPDLTMEECVESIHRVLEKREVQHAVLTGIALDILAEKDLLPEPLLSIVKRDEPLYGVDEILALAVTNVYGSVGLTSFGYLDKRKLGVIKRLNSQEQGRVHTFLDDMVAAVAAAAAARIAHQRKAQAEDRPMLEDNSDLYPRGEQAPPAQAASR